MKQKSKNSKNNLDQIMRGHEKRDMKKEIEQDVIHDLEKGMSIDKCTNVIRPFISTLQEQPTHAAATLSL